jgi:hypothetical protein
MFASTVNAPGPRCRIPHDASTGKFHDATEIPMTISMYQASVPVFIHALRNLSAILRKAVAHAEANKINPAALLGTRLYPDMYPLVRQIQLATDNAKGPAGRLAGIERPIHEDNETSFDELQARIEKTVAFLKSIKPEQIDGSEEKTITLTVRGNEIQFLGQAYLLHFALPNFFFHVTTAYAILRHCGVELGKLDYLGGQQR